MHRTPTLSNINVCTLQTFAAFILTCLSTIATAATLQATMNGRAIATVTIPDGWSSETDDKGDINATSEGGPASKDGYVTLQILTIPKLLTAGELMEAMRARGVKDGLALDKTSLKLSKGELNGMTAEFASFDAVMNRFQMRMSVVQAVTPKQDAVVSLLYILSDFDIMSAKRRGEVDAITKSVKPFLADDATACATNQAWITRTEACTRLADASHASGHALAVVLSHRGVGYMLGGDTRHAEADVAEALRLDPKLADAYSTRAKILALVHNDYDGSIKAFSEAVRLDPKNSSFVYNRGAIYLGKGDADHAITDLTEAIRLDPKEVDAYYRRGMAYEKTGQYDRAVADWQKFSEMKPGDEHVKDDIARVKREQALRKK